MAFVEVRFPDDIAFGSSGGPEYSTDVVITQSGHEQRNVNWSQARAHYNVAHGVKTQQQLGELIAFFRARKGRAVGFRFKDWADYQAESEYIGTGNGTKTLFQLQKNYSSGEVSEARIIYKPVQSSVVLYANDGIISPSAYTVNYLEGTVQFVVAPVAGVVLTADFEFDVPVRFDTDRLSASLDAYGVNSWTNIPLVEVRIS
jgi:uncharacterized protein (TIGR02217 family)